MKVLALIVLASFAGCSPSAEETKESSPASEVSVPVPQPTTIRGEPNDDQDEIRRRNEEKLAQLAEELEQHRIAREGLEQETDHLERAEAEAKQVEAKANANQVKEDARERMAIVENQMRTLVEEHEELKTRYQQMLQRCSDQTESGWIDGEDDEGRLVSGHYSGTISRWNAGCSAEQDSILSQAQIVLITYDRLYHDYTLQAMTVGLMLEAVRRQLPGPGQR